MTVGMQELPHSVEMEEACLGSLFIDPDAYALLGSTLDGSDFYRASYRQIFEAVAAAACNGVIDIATVSDHLERSGKLKDVGGLTELTRLINCVPSAFHLETYAQAVAGYALRRRGLLALSAGAKHFWDLETDATTAQARAEGELIAAHQDNDSSVVNAKTLAFAMYDQVQEWTANPLKPGQVRGLRTGMKTFDRWMGGLRKGMYIVAARPSMGKTAIMLQMASGLCQSGYRVLFFTIEMSAQQLGFRLASSIAQVSLRTIEDGALTSGQMDRVQTALAKISELPLTVIDQATLRPPDVLAAARRQQLQQGAADVIFVDGLWLMEPTRERGSRVLNVGSISREMKRSVQRGLDIPVVMAHQLNRKVEERANKIPILSDLRETGDVEQDADVVLMLYRAGMYDEKAKDADVLRIQCRKNRLNGPGSGFVNYYWVGDYVHCVEIEKQQETM